MIIMTCIYTPFTLAFVQNEDLGYIITDQALNLMFGIDLVINFISAYYDDDYNIIDDYKVRDACFHHHANWL